VNIPSLLGCAMLAWLPFIAVAQPFPAGPITLVIPLAPGDAADIAARALGEEMSRLLKTPVVPINRPGAGGAVGTGSVVQAKKDGHTILFAQNSALTFRAVLDPQSVTYDALRDLTPLGTGLAYADHPRRACRCTAPQSFRADRIREEDIGRGAHRPPGIRLRR
jgi:tripartite-type tricarboxylate transporter receptor subunit TctC